MSQPAALRAGDRDVQFAAAVAEFGMLLRNSEHKGAAGYDSVLEIARSATGADVHGYRKELLEMVRQAMDLGSRRRADGVPSSDAEGR